MRDGGFRVGHQFHFGFVQAHAVRPRNVGTDPVRRGHVIDGSFAELFQAEVGFVRGLGDVGVAEDPARFRQRARFLEQVERD